MTKQLRLLALGALVALVGACSTTEDAQMAPEDETLTIYERENINVGAPVSDVYDEDLQGPQPGTQADLVVNVGDRVFYGYDRYDLSPEARATLDAQADWLIRYPNLNVTIEGHADERGTREYNLALGERRANSAKNYLIALGVDPRRVNIISYGKERPAVPGSNDAAWAQNRRAVTKID